MQAVIQENKQLVKDLFEDLNQGDVARALARVAEDIDWWVIGRAKVSGHKDKRLVGVTLKSIFRSFRSFRFVLHDITAEDNRVAVTAESIGRHKSQRDYNNHYHFLFFLRNGQIERVKEYFDTDHAIWIETPPAAEALSADPGA